MIIVETSQSTYLLWLIAQSEKEETAGSEQESSTEADSDHATSRLYTSEEFQAVESLIDITCQRHGDEVKVNSSYNGTVGVPLQ